MLFLAVAIDSLLLAYKNLIENYNYPIKKIAV
jgi:hypothetical protein